MNYLRIGQKYGIALKDEVVNSIQARLEKSVSSYISRHSKEIAPIEAKFFVFHNSKKTIESTVSCSENEYDRIIDIRAAARSRKYAKLRQHALEEAMKTYKEFNISLEAYVKKVEQKSDWRYRQFLLGAAKHNSNSQQHSEPICFKSQSYKDFNEKLRSEINNHEV